MLAILMAAMTVTPGWAQVDSATNRGDTTEGLPVPEALRDIGSLTPGMTLAEWREVAREATEAERWGDAIRILVEADRRQPEDLDTLTLLAIAYGRAADKKRKDPNDPERDRKVNALIAGAVTVFMRAVPIAAATGKAEFAERMLDQVLRYQPKNPEALLMLARLQSNTMRGLVAIEQYKRYVATEAGKKDSKAYLEMGRLYRALKYYNHAISALRKAKEFDPQSDKILAELALAYMDDKAYDDATKLIEEVVRRWPKVPEYRYIQSLVLTATKQLKEANTAAGDAIKLMREELRETPADVAKLRSLDKYYRTYEAALQAFLMGDPDNMNMEARIDLARALQEHADVTRTLSFHRALTLLSQVPEEGRKNIRRLEAMAEIQLQVFRYEDAVLSCQQLLKLDPDNPIAGRIYEAIPDRYKKDAESQPAETGS